MLFILQFLVRDDDKIVELPNQFQNWRAPNGFGEDKAPIFEEILKQIVQKPSIKEVSSPRSVKGVTVDVKVSDEISSNKETSEMPEWQKKIVEQKRMKADKERLEADNLLKEEQERIEREKSEEERKLKEEKEKEDRALREQKEKEEKERIALQKLEKEKLQDAEIEAEAAKRLEDEQIKKDNPTATPTVTGTFLSFPYLIKILVWCRFSCSPIQYIFLLFIFFVVLFFKNKIVFGLISLRVYFSLY